MKKLKRLVSIKFAKSVISQYMGTFVNPRHCCTCVFAVTVSVGRLFIYTVLACGGSWVFCFVYIFAGWHFGCKGLLFSSI